MISSRYRFYYVLVEHLDKTETNKALHCIARLCALLWMCVYIFEDRCAVFVTYT